MGSTITELLWESQTPMPSLAKRMKDPEWERKQRQREYRVASRREKRNRKADEKKQRKLNATILRRMTRNPEKYNKNADRNKRRDIEAERKMIQANALRQAERLAAVHDPTGKMFNVSAVVVQQDGTVISREVLRIREERAREKAERLAQQDISSQADTLDSRMKSLPKDMIIPEDVDPERFKAVAVAQMPTLRAQGLSKTQQKRLLKYETRRPLSRPVLPPGISAPEGEENWIALWDITDEELYRRVIRAKKRKANERKMLRQRQKAGKSERRAARDEKRRVYRELKETWKVIKADEKRFKTSMKQVELRAVKAIAVELNATERGLAMAKCAELGFTLDNVAGLNEITPKFYGLKGRQIDLNELNIGDGLEIRPKNESRVLSTSNRVDLSGVVKEPTEYIGPPALPDENAAVEEEFNQITLDIGNDLHHENLNYNHHLRRKIRRALDKVQIEKETKVRQQTIEHCIENKIPIPSELDTSARAESRQGQRILENGTLETAKQERTRSRLDLAEFNSNAKILRRQAKQIALEAGLRLHAELTGRLPQQKQKVSDTTVDGYGEGWYVPPPADPEDSLRPDDLTIRPREVEISDAMSIDSEEEDSGGSKGFELHGVKFL